MLCLTPITLDQPKKTLNVKSTVINESFTVNMNQKKQNLTSETSTSSGSFVKKKNDTLRHYDERTKETVQEHTDLTSGPSIRNSKTFQKENIERNNTN